MRRAAMVQLPAGRSVKMTIAPDDAIRSRISSSTPCADRSRLVTPMKRSDRPVICSTADNIPSAKVPWPATRARTLLIVLDEILARVPRVAHAIDQTLVKGLGRVLAVIPQQVI